MPRRLLLCSTLAALIAASVESEAQQQPPAPAPPRPGDQEPGPYLPPAEDEGFERKLEVGPDVGVTLRPARGDSIDYSPGWSWGAHVRVELTTFLGFRAYFNNTSHGVEIPTGALGLGAAVEQEDISVTVIGARLEPTWVVTPRLRLWLGAGVAWGRVFAEEPSTNPPVSSFDRTGVLLEWTGSLGASFDAIPSWLAVTLLLNGGVASNQSGDVFDRTQVIDQAGQVAHLAGLPEFESTFSALLGVGLIL